MKLPAIIGSTQILNVSGTATVSFGDTAFISPITVSKTTHGSGSSSTGGFIINNNFLSFNNTIDTGNFR
ncbi:spore germination protein [Heyndrickxia ginsengihumi]|uniref:spore germination protein n=1 Tax=Heyndrickxia ginsengihumi TaxID=363870 RepID=UPI003527DCF2